MREIAAVRTMLALVAASAGVFICVVQQHFVLRLSRPTGLTTMFQHRCGLVMVAAVVWMLVEVGFLAGRWLGRRHLEE